MGETAQQLLTASDLATRTGLSVRYFQKLAASGRIDWATQPDGKGTDWLFCRRGAQAWLAAGCKAPGGGTWRIAPAKPKPTPSSTDDGLTAHLRGLLYVGLPSSPTGYVYFIAPSMRSQRIKIGWAVSPMDRLKDLQAAHPERLRVLWATPGTRRDETAMQRRFREHRIRGDWFWFSDAIRSHIQGIANG
jgi:hypothetical protein